MFFFKETCGQKVQIQPHQALEVTKQISKRDVMKYYFKQMRSRYQQFKNHSDSQSETNQVEERLKKNEPPQIINLTKTNMMQVFIKSSGQVVKKILKSNYQEIVSQYKDTDRLYCDPDFLPNDKFLGKKFVRGSIKWKRISQIIPNAEFISDTICPEDILQGALGNCYFLSALAAIAENDFRIKNIFPNLTINKNGIYMAKLRHLGVLREVVVDDYIPINKNGEPFFAKPAGGKQIWVMILEKCWAKLFGSYESVIGGYSNEVLHAFSGAPTFQYQIDFKDPSDSEVLFKRLILANEVEAIMCCGTQSDEKIPDIQKTGLVKSHAYSLIEVYSEPQKMVKLRNPWGKQQWNGRASQKDLQFWNQFSLIQKNYLGLKFKDDGIFFMLWQDYIKYFKSIDICMVSDNANYLYHQSTYQSNIAQMFQFETEGGHIYVSFSQTNLREFDWREKKSYGKVTLVIAKQIQTPNGIDYEYVDSNSDDDYPDYSLKLRKLQRGKYVVYVNVDWTRKPTDVGTISVYTQSIISLTQSKVNSQQFLQKTYLSHARNNKAAIQSISNQQVSGWKCKALLLEKCGFGYLAMHLDAESKVKLKLQIKESVYSNLQLQIQAPYKGKASSIVTLLSGKQFILIFRVAQGSYIDKIEIPDLLVQQVK